MRAFWKNNETKRNGFALFGGLPRILFSSRTLIVSSNEQRSGQGEVRSVPEVLEDSEYSSSQGCEVGRIAVDEVERDMRAWP